LVHANLAAHLAERRCLVQAPLDQAALALVGDDDADAQLARNQRVLGHLHSQGRGDLRLHRVAAAQRRVVVTCGDELLALHYRHTNQPQPCMS
jgi:hypothetical protein